MSARVDKSGRYWIDGRRTDSVPGAFGDRLLGSAVLSRRLMQLMILACSH